MRCWWRCEFYRYLSRAHRKKWGSEHAVGHGSTQAAMIALPASMTDCPVARPAQQHHMTTAKPRLSAMCTPQVDVAEISPTSHTSHLGMAQVRCREKSTQMATDLNRQAPNRRRKHVVRHRPKRVTENRTTSHAKTCEKKNNLPKPTKSIHTIHKQ